MLALLAALALPGLSAARTCGTAVTTCTWYPDGYHCTGHACPAVCDRGDRHALCAEATDAAACFAVGAAIPPGNAPCAWNAFLESCVLAGQPACTGGATNRSACEAIGAASAEAFSCPASLVAAGATTCAAACTEDECCAADSDTHMAAWIVLLGLAAAFGFAAAARARPAAPRPAATATATAA